MGPDWESWDQETVRREVASLVMGDLVGVPEVEVRARFGEPDDVVRPGGETSDPAGNVLFRADADLRYYRLLPHTCLSISTAAGRVAEISWWPKWKRCPEGSPARPATYMPRSSSNGRSNERLERPGTTACTDFGTSRAGRSAAGR